MRFIDLFAGLGGFNLAITSEGHQCVFASEIDTILRSLYGLNHGIEALGDIRKISPEDIPDHDVLCAGFPCQSFSKAGSQRGRECPTWGDLIDFVVKILEEKAPKYFILENVPNLEKHANGSTWRSIQTTLKNLGYEVAHKRLSPHSFGIPQVRDRMFIVGSKTGLGAFAWPEPTNEVPDIRTVLDVRPENAKAITAQLKKCLNVWQQFLDLYPQDEELPSFPIWSMEFGANYPVHLPPSTLSLGELLRYRGAYGVSLKNSGSKQEVEKLLPKYARGSEELPKWKQDFILQNRQLYERNKKWIDDWRPALDMFSPSLQKFEWNCKGSTRNIKHLVVQIRASGVRVKRPTTAPSLIAMTTTQVPIIAWEERYMTPLECARLQGMDRLNALPVQQGAAYKALGNAVNVEIIRLIVSELLGSSFSAEHPIKASLQLPLQMFGQEDSPPLTFA